MSISLYIIFISIACFRLSVLLISKQNEHKLLKQGGIEYDKNNTKILAILHIVFYFMSFFEGIAKHRQIDPLSIIGIIITLLSYLVLIHVISVLGGYWTVKLISTPNHTIIKKGLFRIVKHPNYLLNIIPELIGVTLMFHSWISCVVLILPYLHFLQTRISMENRLLNEMLAIL